MALPAGIAAILANSPRAIQVLQGLGVLTGGTIAATEAQKQLQDLPEGSLEEAYKRVFLGPAYELSNLDVFKTKTPEAEDTTLKAVTSTPSGLVLGPTLGEIDAAREQQKKMLQPPVTEIPTLYDDYQIPPTTAVDETAFSKPLITIPPKGAGEPIIETFPVADQASKPLITTMEKTKGEVAPTQPVTEEKATTVFKPNQVDIQRIQDLAPTTQLPGEGPLNFLAKDKNTKQYIEATNPVKIFGETNLKEINYTDKLPAPITYKFNPEVYDQVYNKALTEIGDKVNVDIPTLTKKFGMKAPDIELVNKSLEAAADPDERYWYQKSGGYLKDLVQTVDPNATDKDVADFIDIVSLTSGGVEPKQNLKLALGVYSDLKQGQPVQTGFRTKASLDKYLLDPRDAINSPKFGNFTDTMKYFAGVSDRQPNVVNDLQMAKLFGVKPDQLASNPELYNAMTTVMNNLTEEVNKNLPAGAEPLQPFELQSLMWSQSRGLASNYQQVGEQLIKELSDQGINIATDVMQPDFSAKLQKTIAPYQQSMKATIEVGSFLTPPGQQIESLINQYGDNTRLMTDINKIHRRHLGSLITKKAGQPSVMEEAISNVIGQKAEISRMQEGLGTYEGKANYNVIVPLMVNTAKGPRQLTDPERLQTLALVGKNLNQAAMAASNFKAGEVSEGRMATGQIYVKAPVDQGKIQELHKMTGYDYNITPVAGGFVGSVISFDGAPDEAKIQKSFEKVFGKDAEMDYIDSSWKGDYLEAKDYDRYIDGIQKSDIGGMEGERSTGKYRRDLDSITKKIQDIAAARDADYSKLSEQPYIKKLGQVKSGSGSSGSGSVEPVEKKSKYTLSRELDPKLLDEMLLTRGGVKGFQESMQRDNAPLPPSTKRQMFIRYNEKIMDKYGFDKSDKDINTIPPEELKKLRQKYFVKEDAVDYIVSAAYDVIGGKKERPNEDTIFALDDEGLPVAAIKMGMGNLFGKGRMEGIAIEEAGSLFPEAMDTVIEEAKKVAKKNGKKFLVAEDLTSDAAYNSFIKRGFKPAKSKKFNIFEGKLVYRPGGGRKVKQKNLVLELE